MKKLFSVFAASVMVFGLASGVFAADMMKGEVVSIDVAGKSVVIKTDAGEKTVPVKDDAVLKGIKAGQKVEVNCIDIDGKSCASSIKVISGSKAVKGNKPVTGEVVSIDPEGKSVVIKTSKGKEMTIVTTPETKVMKGSGKKAEAAAMTDVKPGMKVKMDCMDQEGKSCAKKITIIPAKEAVKGGAEITGEVVSIDSAKKSVVIKTESGEKTIYFQKGSKGIAMDKLEVGKKIKANCIDAEGKSCIKSIEAE